SRCRSGRRSWPRSAPPKPGWPARSRFATRTTETSTTARTTPSAPSACSSTSGCDSSRATSSVATSCSVPEAVSSTTPSTSRPPAARGSTADGRARFARRSFIDRYVFPDGELHEVGSVVSAIQRAGFEARHMETLREHYALTLRRWVANLEANWDACVADAGVARARIWRLYMAASALQFEANRAQVHHVLATKTDGGRSGLALRPRFE